MTIAIPDSTSRKRSRCPSETTVDEAMEATTANKSVRLDFYLQRMEHRLQWALKCARGGNERMMMFYLEQAEKDALESGNSVHTTFLRWKLWIGGQLQRM